MNTKAKIGWFVGVVVVLLLIIGASLGGVFNHKSAAKKESVVTLGSTGTSYPTAYKEDGKLKGFDVEVAQKAFEQEGYKVRWVNGDFDGLLQQLSNNKIQGVSNAISYSAERAKQYTFSKLYARYAQQIAVPKDSTIAHVAELQGLTVASVQGSSNINNLQKYDSKIRVQGFESRDSAITAATSKKVAGVTNSGPILKSVIKNKGVTLKVLPEKIAEDKDGVIFTNDKPGRKNAKIFNAGLTKIYKNGQLKSISEKYFGEDITIKGAFK